MPREPRPPDGRGSARHLTRSLHRWLGICAAAFAVLLSVSGIMLNHAGKLGLSESYVQADWLLNWYGIEAPQPAASFAVGTHRVTQLGERIYFDEHDLGPAGGMLAGAVELASVFVVAAGRDLLLLTGDGELIERVEVAAVAPAPIERIGREDGAVIVRLGGQWYRSDPEVVGLSRVESLAQQPVDWSLPSAVPPPRLEALERLYRGRGVSQERLLADVHSGRLFGRYGPLVMDLTGLAVLGLGISGLVLFLRYRRRRRR